MFYKANEPKYISLILININISDKNAFLISPVMWWKQKFHCIHLVKRSLYNQFIVWSYDPNIKDNREPLCATACQCRITKDFEIHHSNTRSKVVQNVMETTIIVLQYLATPSEYNFTLHFQNLSKLSRLQLKYAIKMFQTGSNIYFFSGHDNPLNNRRLRKFE